LGYKKIANYLTEEGIPAPRMSERQRKEAAREESHKEAKATWAIVTVQGILDNDFYIGTGSTPEQKSTEKTSARTRRNRLSQKTTTNPSIDYRIFALTKAARLHLWHLPLPGPGRLHQPPYLGGQVG